MLPNAVELLYDLTSIPTPVLLELGSRVEHINVTGWELRMLITTYLEQTGVRVTSARKLRYLWLEISEQGTKAMLKIVYRFTRSTCHFSAALTQPFQFFKDCRSVRFDREVINSLRPWNSIAAPPSPYNGKSSFTTANRVQMRTLRTILGQEEPRNPHSTVLSL